MVGTTTGMPVHVLAATGDTGELFSGCGIFEALHALLGITMDDMFTIVDAPPTCPRCVTVMHECIDEGHEVGPSVVARVIKGM